MANTSNNIVSTGITLIQSDSNVAHGVNTYVVDEEEQVKNLPVSCKPGSQAFVIESGNVYFLNSKREWKQPKDE